ncbi:hypothetical protein H6F89_33140 [Cyanobacteria bacterium FACHB-63]|nr:hypothetical protein [Cyanobacteria bacterium FACHB-63]
MNRKQSLKAKAFDSRQLSFALIADHQVVGAVTAGVREEGTLDMIWGYISRRYSNPVAVSLLKSLYAHQFRAGRARGLTKADIEVDTTDAVLSALLDWLPVCEDRVWRILQRPRSLSAALIAAD